MYNPETSLLNEGSEVLVGKDPKQAKSMELLQVLEQNSRYVVRFAHASTRDEAESLTGSELFVSRDEFPETEEGEFYVCDMIGLEVKDSQGKRLGVLVDVMATASNDIYVVDGDKGEVLLPVIPGVIKQIDLDGGKITVDPPEVVNAF